jgi:single-strand DNA-binding protein
MLMDMVTMTGLVATTPRHNTTTDGKEILSFRLASSSKHYDEENHKWVHGETNWYTVVAHGALALNGADSLEKGQRVVVSGELQVRDWANDDRSGVHVEVIANAMGHDLLWGSSKFTRAGWSHPE